MLVACNKVENASPKVLSKITIDKISTITKIIKAKPEETKAVIENIKASQLARKSAGARKMEDGDETEEDMAQIESELSNMQNNPNDALVSIANEYQGDEKIALMEIMYTGGSYQAFSERYSHLGVDLSEQFVPEGTYNAFQNQNSRMNGPTCYDCKLHALAGASIVLFAVGVAYIAIPRFSITWKAATLIAAGLAAGIVSGLLKELADLHRKRQNNTISHEVALKDVLMTGLGGMIGGGVLVGGIAILHAKPLLLGATLTGVSLFLSRNLIKNLLKCCILNRCSCEF